MVYHYSLVSTVPLHRLVSKTQLTAVDFIALVQAVVVTIAQPVPGDAAAISAPMLSIWITHCRVNQQVGERSYTQGGCAQQADSLPHSSHYCYYSMLSGEDSAVKGQTFSV